MGGFTTGFLGAVGDAAKKRADERKAQLDKEKAAQADIYHQVIKNPQASKEQIEYANAQLAKLYPKDPQIKQIFEKVHGLMKQVHPGHQQDQGQGQGQPEGQPQGAQGPIASPPQPKAEDMEGAGSAAAPTATGTIATPPFNPNAKGGIPAPPQPAAAKGQDPRFPEMAHVAAGPTMAEQDTRMLGVFKQQQQILHENKMAEIEAMQKAKAQFGGGAPPRPVFSKSTSVLDARNLAKNFGRTYEGEDGEPIDVDNIPDTMSLQPYTTRVTETDENGNSRPVWKTRYLPISPDQKEVNLGGVTYAVNPADKSKIPGGAGTAIGVHNIPSTTSTTDPATGQTTVSKKVPTITGAAGRAGGAAPTGTTQAPTAPSATPPAKSPPIAKSGAGTSTKGSQEPLPTDPDGGIPEATTRFNGLPISPQVREGANQLLKSERDVKDLPAKTKELSASLARAYGWDQNAFTPLERRQIGVAAHFIDNLIKNPNLSVLDQDFWDQLPMIGATGDVGKESFLGKLGTKLAARNISDEQADFLRDYRQLASVISGLGKLSRGGRVTESTVNRLLSDLPNPSNTKDAADAVRRLQLLKQEIATALDNGTFEQLTKANRKSSIAAPPKPSDVSAGQLSQAAKDYLKSQNIPVE